MQHGFCTHHRIAYNTDFDLTCPQCNLAQLPPQKQLEWDTQLQMPLNDSGTPVDPRSLKVVK